MNYDLILRSHRTFTPDGERPADVGIRDGVIATVAGFQALAGNDAIDLGDCALLPGLVDTHVHVNEPGRTQWEGFDSATRAAAAGGVTTIVDMPLNSIPPTVDVQALHVKRAAAVEQCFVDVGFWGGAVPGNARQLPALHSQGVFGFKAFLVDSGVPEFPPLDPAGLEEALGAVDALFVLHAEDPSLVTAAHGEHFTDFVASRPPRAERRAVAAVIDAAQRTGARVHILHLAAADALPLIAAARREGVRITAETCPHYLTLDASQVPDGATQYKCCPPIRDKSHQDALWQALADGVIDCVVSDHSPCPPELKAGDFGTAWGGIASVQLGLPLIWTAAAQRGHSLADVVRWMAGNTADLVGLPRKGRIAEGADADLVAFDPDAEFTVDATRLLHRHHVSPYDGRHLRGVVRDTWLRGRLAGVEPIGRLIRPGGGA